MKIVRIPISAFGALVLFSIVSGVSAQSIWLVPTSAVDNVYNGDIVSFNVAMDFSDYPRGTLGGGFDINFDSGALQFMSFNRYNVGDPAFGRDPDVLDGLLESWGHADFNGLPLVAVLGDVSFQVLPTMGSSTTVSTSATNGVAGPWVDGTDFVTIISVDYNEILVTRADSEEVLRYENLPASYGSNFGEFPMDTWTISCPLGGSVRIRVDVKPTPGHTTSNLLPVAWLSYGATLVGTAFNDVACSVPLDCPAYMCAHNIINCPWGGEYLLNINNGSAPPCGEKAGYYALAVEVFDGPHGTGAALPAEQVQLGGQKTVIVVEGTHYPAGPLRDDVYGFRDPDLVAPGSAARGEAMGDSQISDGLERNDALPPSH